MLYHGSTRRFDRFDNTKGIRAHFGNYVYLSTQRQDCVRNYCFGGPDAKHNITNIAYDIWQYFVDSGDIPDYKIAKQLAYEYVIGDGSYLYHCDVKCNNPFVMSVTTYYDERTHVGADKMCTIAKMMDKQYDINFLHYVERYLDGEYDSETLARNFAEINCLRDKLQTWECNSLTGLYFKLCGYSHLILKRADLIYGVRMPLDTDHYIVFNEDDVVINRVETLVADEEYDVYIAKNMLGL